MRTETRIGVVTGLTVVVAASVYFWRSKAEERDLIVALTPKSPGETAPVITIPRPAQTAKSPVVQTKPPAPAPAPPTAAIALAGGPNPAASSTIGPPAPLIPLRTGPSDLLRDAAAPAADQPSRPVLQSAGPPASPVNAGPPSATTPIAPPSAPPPSAVSDRPAPAATTEKPAIADATPPAPPGDWPKYHLVAKGETLSSIARQTYNDPQKSELILAANPEVKDPRQLHVGMKLTLPSPLPDASAGASAPKPTTLMARSPDSTPPPATLEPAHASDAPAASVKPTATYKVQPGDSFYSIAESKLGSGGRWKELLELNKTLVGGDPKKLRAGMTLTLPPK